MNDTTSRIESLEKSIDSQLKKSKTSLIAVIAVYIVLVIIVLGYTTFIVTYTKALAKPPVVAEFIISNIQTKVPALTQTLKDNSKAYGSFLAKQTLAYIKSFIPLLANMARGQLDNTVEVINSQMNENYLPLINEYFKLNKDKINEMFRDMTDEQIATQLNEMMYEELDRNAELLNAPIGDSINQLKARIDKLANTPNSQLNNQELAQKRVIAYWIYLVKYQELTGFKALKLNNDN
ncbi:MAG TPA: hypothetical protein DD381_14160 [Lentisphaeria bacterium]|nr:MAG: hypothetical protein A2X47_01105 [Lentisphaerae bacterium GWF2_38_69]HBM17468.1 hypothetical protein [Lentisphaeria bacterium]